MLKLKFLFRKKGDAVIDQNHGPLCCSDSNVQVVQLSGIVRFSRSLKTVMRNGQKFKTMHV